MKKDIYIDDETLGIINFAYNLNTLNLKEINFGKFKLPIISTGVKSRIQYNLTDDIDILQNKQQYTVSTLQGEVEISLQLYENSNNHYRLFCYTRFNNIQGMTFSVNLTTEKDVNNAIFLTQKIRFSERYKGNPKLASEHRRQKQIVFADLLRKLEIEVTDNNDIILGIFDTKSGAFVNTSAERFLNDFIMISLLKGHFQGNKGYQLEILPTLNNFENFYQSQDETIEKLPIKLIKNTSSRNIPLAYRYKVLKRDNFRCLACGRNVEDNIKLHIDHKMPFSLGGLTTLENLQTLCSDCNISKSNKFID